MEIAELLSKYRIFGNSRRTVHIFNTVIEELVDAQLLSKDSKENITADREIFDELLPLRKEMLEITVEV